MKRIDIFVMGLVLFSSVYARAQSTWEVTPYEVNVWWVVADQPDLPEHWKASMPATMARQLRTKFVGVCNTTVEPAPSEIRLAIQRDLNDLSREQLFSSHPELSKIDKLFLIVFDAERQTFRVRVREFDCLLTHFGPTDVTTTHVLQRVIPQTSQLITQAFSPVVRIDRASGKVAKTRLRAGALMQNATAAGTLRENDVLLPFDRRVQSSGKAPLSGVRPIDWTYLRVPRELAQSGFRELEIISGYRQPFRSKRSRRQQQYAIRTRPQTDATTIRLLSRGKKEPLPGYEVHEKGDTATRFLGYTDWRGELAIPADTSAVRLLLVRSGERVLAKLPVVPGLRGEIEAFLRDNSLRIEADGFLTGVQMGIIDLVARRESLTQRIRSRIAEKDYERAESLLDEFRQLPTQSNFRDDVEQQLSALNLGDSNNPLATQIRTTFVQTISTLGKYLDPNRARDLETELNQAKGS